MSIEGINVPYLIDTNAVNNDYSNKNYFPQSGVSNDVSISFFIDNPATGIAIVESVLPTSWLLTGYSISCDVSGSGSPMSGNFYQKDTLNNKVNLFTFTFPQGTYFQQSGGINQVVTGQRRFGLNLTNVLSLGKNFSIGLFGYSGVAYSGIPTNSPPTIALFIDIPYTGNLITEHIVPSNFIYTGYALGCGTTGSGIPMSGNIYQKSQTNVTSTLSNFTFEAATSFKSSGGFAIKVTGLNRVGLNITNVLSGCLNLSLSIFGA